MPIFLPEPALRPDDDGGDGASPERGSSDATTEGGPKDATAAEGASDDARPEGAAGEGTIEGSGGDATADGNVQDPLGKDGLALVGVAEASLGAGCTGGGTSCDGGCALLASDAHNCGACGNDCGRLANVSAAGLACGGGRCSYQCAAGYADCADSGTGCATSLRSTANCGACGANCTGAASACALGDGGGYACTVVCPSATTNCGGNCADLTSDAKNCGACGMACEAGTRCSGSHCVCDAMSGCNGCCSSAATCEAYTSQSSAICGPGGGVCGACGASDGCHVAGACALGVCAASPPAPNTTACFTAQHATSALCDGLGNCHAVGCANGYVNDQGTCKVPNCTGVACGGSDGAGGICTGTSGTCGAVGQHCNGSGQCVCDGTSCAGCCDSNGQCNPPSDATCGIGGGLCQACSMLSPPFSMCIDGNCRLTEGANCVTDTDCVPGGCFNGTCLGTRGIAGQVACGPIGQVVCPASEGCSYTVSGGSSSTPACGTANGSSVILCDAPNDCASGQDCCISTNCVSQTIKQCYPQAMPGVAGSGCPPSSVATCTAISLVCDPRAPTCP